MATVSDDRELYARNVAATLKKAGFTRVCTALPNDATQQESDLLEKTIATAADEKPLQQLLKDLRPCWPRNTAHRH